MYAGAVRKVMLSSAELLTHVTHKIESHGFVKGLQGFVCVGCDCVPLGTKCW
ncbi:MAG: hypothetical protein LBK06_05935 [Planctomycetaceae bacterium]|nr:hypothetical protein [Planctomycetaceae bacterium]